ncbi:related to Meiotically up-regulated gene 157 protein [Rhynchosporium secalis]|uniref:Related to Meiotically up-regulated gene 157 protein n=1 Tax=Rhynchosporium secalis TaxID=38038 RepID=A0A1E1MGP7_RHYSE|nr:related to Meiotically up-regulated gene 157 protein [Rhynchosporium secalis]
MRRVQQRIVGAAVLVSLVLLYVWYNHEANINQGPRVISYTSSDSAKPVKEGASAVTSTSSSQGYEPQSSHDAVSSVSQPATPVSQNVAIETSLTEPQSTKPPSSSTPIQSAEPSHSPPAECVRYEDLQRSRQKPWSEGSRQFPYSRPSPECRTFNLPAMEKLIEKMKGVIKDPDLFRLFENSYPNTLDTMIKWRGFAKEQSDDGVEGKVTDEELTYVITGDIDAMWLRDSASQVLSYLPLLEASTEKDSLASLWRGLINIHARYIIISPYCHSFQPPPESGIPPTHNGAYTQNHPMPAYDPSKVFDCKWELDSLASFLQISVAYYERTKDIEFFQKYKWVQAVRQAIIAAGAMRLGTYSKEGKVEASAWTFTGWTNRGSETLTNDGLGNPTKENGMVRSAFRPSDDACIYQLFVPANMMWAKYLEDASLIMEKLTGDNSKNLTTEMRDFAYGIRKGIDKDAIVHHKDFGDIFAYEIDGYGGSNLMDDANVPSLLAMPLWNYTESAFKLPTPAQGEKAKDYKEIYANTRRFVLGDSNPYFMKGPVISAVGGPHIGPGKAWPMAAIIRALTSFSILGLAPTNSLDKVSKKDIEEEVKQQVMMVLNSTDGSGVIHESVDTFDQHQWSRAWFGWANGLFGELMIKIFEEDVKEGRNPGWLGESWQ